ncbi:hypothetical protein [Kitasatospora purpeofusca]|uniref:hypothetical protein n=1 Tax=Kitasatospora purpeofusca TaxID=67352 RepID=UPI003F4ACBB9
MPQLNPFPHEGDGGLGPPASAKGWHQGYIAAVSSPSGLPRTPSARSTEFMDAFELGAAAGRADGLAEGWRWRYFGEDVRTGRETGQGPQPARSPVEPVDSGEDGPAGPTYPLAWHCVGTAALRVVLEQFAPGSDREFPGLRLDRVCADKGVGRLYLPVRLLPRDPPAEPAGDPLGDQGFWHGTTTDSFADAVAAEGPDGPHPLVTRAPTFLGLVRYRPAGEHDFWDVLPADGRMPPTSD